MRVVPVLLVLAALAAGCGADDDEPEASASGCESVEAPEPRDAEILEAPSEALDSGTTYSLVFETTCGSFRVQLDQETAPETSASLVALARNGYFDDTIFHRVVPGFVIQGGDPTQSGAGGPGYSTVDAPPSDAQPLSQILQALEQARDVAYFEEVEWDDDDGYWDIEYVDGNGAEVEIEVDPVSGQVRR